MAFNQELCACDDSFSEARRDKKLAKLQQRFHKTQVALQAFQKDGTATQEALIQGDKIVEVTGVQVSQEQTLS